MSQKISKKHHFIPQFYINGFADENKDIYTYDVTYKSVGKTPKKSAQIFYVEDLHTIEMYGEKSLLIEDSYSILEGDFNNVIAYMKAWPNNALSEIVKVPEFSKILILMLSVQYWRNPVNTIRAKQVSEDLIGLFDRAYPTNYEVIPISKKDIKYFYKKRKHLGVQKFIQYLILPLITFKFDSKQLEGVKLLKLSENQDFMSSDNPVMIESFDEGFCFSGDFLFPLTKEFAITNVNFSKIQDVDNMVLLNARKKVIASSIERLDILKEIS